MGPVLALTSSIQYTEAPSDDSSSLVRTGLTQSFAVRSVDAVESPNVPVPSGSAQLTDAWPMQVNAKSG